LALILKAVALTYLRAWFSLTASSWLLRLLFSRLKPSANDAHAIAYATSLAAVLGLISGIAVAWLVATGRIVMETTYYLFLMHDLSRTIMFLGTAGFLYALVLLIRLWLRGRGKRVFLGRASDSVETYHGLPVIYSETVTAPSLRGVWDAAILLPAGLKDGLPREDLEVILQHELMHHRRRDNFWISLLEALSAVTLNLGAITLLLKRYRRSAELAVDARILQSVPLERYISLLVAYSQENTPANGMDEATRLRLQALLDRKPVAASLRLAVSLLLAAAPTAFIVALMLWRDFRCFFPCFLGY
jgi:Zn-dependent protease with chaperone function